MRHWRLAVAALALGAYAWVSYVLMLRMPGHGWTVLALFGPLIATVALGAWVRRHGPTLAGCAALAAWLAWLVARGGGLDLQRMYVLQHAAIHAVLAWGFAITLRPGSTPLITALAQRIHQHFTPAMRAYTRSLTALWVGYFVGMIVISFGLYAWAPWAWWSMFCTLITPLSALALFVGEHFWRYWQHPEFERASLVQAWQAYQQQASPPSRR